MRTPRLLFASTLTVFAVLLPIAPHGAASARTSARVHLQASLRADFNGDGFADLAVGVAGEDIGTIVDAGAVNVIYGSSTGLHATGNEQWYEGNNGVPGVAGHR